MSYRVMQTTETGEEFCAHTAQSWDDAAQWIEDNADNYPESTFDIEHAAAFHYEGY